MKFMIETDRLILRQMQWDDLSDLEEMLFDPRVMYAYEYTFTEQDAKVWLERQLNRYEQFGFGLWAMVEKESGEMVGQAGITWQECEGEKVLEIGYLLKYRHWHKGYATEAAIACKDYAFSVLGAEKVNSIIKADNFASQKVAERNGMKPEKEFTAVYYNGPVKHILYSIRKEEN